MKKILTASFLAIISLTCFAKQGDIDTLYYDANFETSNQRLVGVNTVGTKGGKIIKMGDFESVKSLADPNTKYVNLKDQTVKIDTLEGTSIKKQ